MIRTAAEARPAPRSRVPRGRVRDAAALPAVPTASGAPILLASAYAVQHLAQDAPPALVPAATVLAAYAPAPPAAFEGLNFRTLA